MTNNYYYNRQIDYYESGYQSGNLQRKRTLSTNNIKLYKPKSLI